MAYSYKFKLYYEDTVFAGIVYYANYFKFIERARSEAIEFVGIDQLDLKSKEMFFIVKKLDANFIKSAKFNDTLIAKTRVKKVNIASVILDQVICSHEKLIFQSNVKIGLIYQGRPVKFDKSIVNCFNKINKIQNRNNLLK